MTFLETHQIHDAECTDKPTLGLLAAVWPTAKFITHEPLDTVRAFAIVQPEAGVEIEVYQIPTVAGDVGPSSRPKAWFIKAYQHLPCWGAYTASKRPLPISRLTKGRNSTTSKASE